MPDPEGNQTDAEIVAELGWRPLPEDEGEVVLEPAPAPQEGTPSPTVEVAKPEVTKIPVGPDPLIAERTALRSEQARTAITHAALQYKQQLLAQGADEATAHSTAETQAGLAWSNFQRDEALNAQNEMAKQALIRELAAEHGVDPKWLAGFQDPDSMRSAAGLYGAQAKQLAELTKKVAAPKVPVQALDSGAGTGLGERSAKQLAYATGRGKSMTADEFEKTFGWNPL